MKFARLIKKLVRRIFKQKISDVHTNLIAQVISYDPNENSCSLQPVLMRIRSEDPNNATTVQLPVLEDVPVKQQGSGKLLLSVAPQVGSYGEVSVMERSLEQWLLQGGIVTPNSARQFDLSDAVFDPGIYPFVVDGDNGKIVEPIAIDRIELRTRSGVTRIAVIDDETVSIVNDDATITIDGDNVLIEHSKKVIIDDGTGTVTLDGGDITVEGGAITIDGSTVDIVGALDANGNFTVDV